MKLKVYLTGALLCMFAFTAVAQHDHGQKPAAAAPAAPAMDPAMMDAMMKAGEPGDAHKKLEGLVGTWDTKVSFWMMPGTDPMASAGVSTNQWVMGGRYLEQRFKGDMGGMPFEGVGYTGYHGKLSMGVGGINACVISRAWDPAFIKQHLGPREIRSGKTGA